MTIASKMYVLCIYCLVYDCCVSLEIHNDKLLVMVSIRSEVMLVHSYIWIKNKPWFPAVSKTKGSWLLFFLLQVKENQERPQEVNAVLKDRLDTEENVQESSVE